ncbi:DeoR/GlpR family DNA-binding transcription regulator [Enterococcus sp. AZ072]|uniref:DeoR/GlpR family DNA-binding transcription regulator n=1 Tax=unclassified Enterococcus TaxID=2608891 RepID=UPI003D29ECA2
MLKDERQKAIMQLLQISGTVKVSDIIKQLNISDMTVRRDLDELEGQGLLERVHGGARLKNFIRSQELSHGEKQVMNIEEKQAIARQAVQLIQENETIFLGPGTTIELLAEVITMQSIQVVTNCLPVFQKLKESSNQRKVYLLGGEMRDTTQSFFGEITNKNLMDIHFHKAFFSCNALNEQDIMTSTFEEGQTQAIALNNSSEKYLLVDHTKIGQKDFYTYYHLKDITTVITNKDKDESYTRIEKDQKIIAD